MSPDLVVLFFLGGPVRCSIDQVCARVAVCPVLTRLPPVGAIFLFLRRGEAGLHEARSLLSISLSDACFVAEQMMCAWAGTHGQRGIPGGRSMGQPHATDAWTGADPK